VSFAPAILRSDLRVRRHDEPRGLVAEQPTAGGLEPAEPRVGQVTTVLKGLALTRPEQSRDLVLREHLWRGLVHLGTLHPVHGGPPGDLFLVLALAQESAEAGEADADRSRPRAPVPQGGQEALQPAGGGAGPGHPAPRTHHCGMDRNRRPPIQCWPVTPLIGSGRVSPRPTPDRLSAVATERGEGNGVQVARLTSTARDAFCRCLDSASGDR
jgi:hypothetical protein